MSTLQMKNFRHLSDLRVRSALLLSAFVNYLSNNLSVITARNRRLWGGNVSSERGGIPQYLVPGPLWGELPQSLVLSGRREYPCPVNVPVQSPVRGPAQSGGGYPSLWTQVISGEVPQPGQEYPPEGTWNQRLGYPCTPSPLGRTSDRTLDRNSDKDRTVTGQG